MFFISGSSEKGGAVPKNSNKLELFYETIVRIAAKLGSFEKRQKYLQRIIDDCEKVYRFVISYKNSDKKSEHISDNIADLDINFLWLLDKNKIGPEIIDEKVLREEQQYYLAAELLNLLGNQNIENIDGIKNLRFAFQVELKRIENINSQIVYSNDGNEINRIKVKSRITDIVRIFEAMKEAEIISKSKTTVSQIAEIFFREVIDKKKFEALYNARKNDVIQLERNSNSRELEEFIKILIERSFSNKDRVLEKIIKYIEGIQKNRIY